jgi:short-subunit dehydrogenase
MKSLTTKYGSWAVVTGASSGIGQSFAHHLARAGMNVVLVSRSRDALEKTANELQSQFAVRTRVLELDLGQPIARETLDLETLDLDVGLLVNNAAIEQRGAFVRHTADELREATELNVTAPTELGQRFGRRFVEQGRGAIIFVSGSIGYQAVPHLASYAASKAHQLNLAEALYYELRPHGVDVLCLSPGLTKTPMVARLEQAIRFGRVGMMQLTPDYVVRVGLKHLGRRPSVVAGWQYKLFALITKLVLSRAAGAWLFGTLVRIAFVDKTLLDPTPVPLRQMTSGTASDHKDPSPAAAGAGSSRTCCS